MPKNAYVLLLLTALFWGGNAVAGKLAVGHVSPMTLTALRWVLGLAVLGVIARENLVARANEMGGYLRSRLEDLQQRFEVIGDVRGLGLLLGVELVTDRASRKPAHHLGALTTQKCFEKGLSMNIRRRPERGSVWRIAPPLTVSREEIDRAVEILEKSLRESLDELTAQQAA